MTPWANNPSTCVRARDVEHGGRFEVHPAPQPRGAQHKAETGRSGRSNAFAEGIQHRKPTSAKADEHSCQRLKRRARHVVAARAGIQHAHTRQSPLTRHYVRSAPARKPPPAVPQRNEASRAANDDKHARARPAGHVGRGPTPTATGARAGSISALET